ncbi:NAD(P)H-hydrate epimerase [Jannaschia marina]|uniref:NAD(P)H-hydrate epimerase n=1 Tax=Jannaschia marina TaxID=2741674 RepID=UPI001F355ED1|nr:NAD(P)H-hydrate epimerase [Jannaschia marina]
MSKPVLTSDEMRALERGAMDAGTVTGEALMERAGQGAVEAILSEYPVLADGPHRAVVLCGPGNNGGDGFVVARLLAARGWDVETFLWGDPARLPLDARTNHDRWRDIGPVHPFPPQQDPRDARLARHPDLWVDAIFGIGQTRALPEAVTSMLHRVYYERNWCRAPVVAIDVPTGLDADTGAELQPFFLAADLTVTFHTEKPGHRQGAGPGRCGTVRVVDIGL